MTFWSGKKQLEMLQLVRFSYEMTATCLKGDYIKNSNSMIYGNPFGENPSYPGEHFNNLNVLEQGDERFRYTKAPRSLSSLLRYPEGPDDGICDPKGDPHPANVSRKKAENGEREPDSMASAVHGYEWMGRFSDYGAVEGNVFKKDGTYYMVFDGSELRDWWSVGGIDTSHRNRAEGYRLKSY